MKVLISAIAGLVAVSLAPAFVQAEEQKPSVNASMLITNVLRQPLDQQQRQLAYDESIRQPGPGAVKGPMDGEVQPDGSVRYGNVKPVERYCSLVEAGQLPLQSHEVLTERQALAEQLILGLRTSDGIPAERLTERCAMERDRLPETLAAWRERGLLVEHEGRARLTEAGFLLSDSLFTELL